MANGPQPAAGRHDQALMLTGDKNQPAVRQVIGGQAVIEGVMMRSARFVSVVLRGSKDDLIIHTWPSPSLLLATVFEIGIMPPEQTGNDRVKGARDGTVESSQSIEARPQHLGSPRAFRDAVDLLPRGWTLFSAALVWGARRPPATPLAPRIACG